MKRRNYLVDRLQNMLSPNLLKLEWRDYVDAQAHPMAGYCYVASEALYHMWGKEHGYRPARVVVGEVGHWFLLGPKGEILDPTAEQFGKTPIPYNEAIGCGFMTKEPSKRAQELIRRMGVRL